MRKSIIIGFFLVSIMGYSQVGINTETPQATLDIVGKPNDTNILDGILAPRLSGDQLKTKIYTAQQTGAIVYITSPLTNSNTPQTINVDSAGYYYFDGLVWIKMNNVTQEPWNIQESENPAGSNTNNIYQNGSVAILKNIAKPGADLDVAGSIRGAASGRLLRGNAVPDVVGKFSMAVGPYSEASEIGTIALGILSKATESGAVAIGSGLDNGTIASGSNSVSIGYDALASASQSISIGVNSIASGTNAMALGYYTTAASKNETTLGVYNAINTGNTNDFIATDPILQIGAGTGTGSNRNNALTILKNGNTGIGISGQGNVAKPSAKLDIGSGNVRIRNINKTIGNSTDRIVVADANGVLKTIPNTAAKSIMKAQPISEVIALSPIHININKSGAQQTDLYAEYIMQLQGHNNNIISSEGAPSTIPTLERQQFYYYVTAYDNNSIKNITLDQNGVLHYDVYKQSNSDSTLQVTIVSK